MSVVEWWIVVRRGDIIWPPFFKRVTVTPAVCPRLFEMLTTLTFGALRRNHTVSTAFATIANDGDKEYS